MVLDRRAGQTKARASVHQAGGPSDLRLWILDGLRLVEDHKREGMRGEHPDIQSQQRIAGQHHIVAGKILPVPVPLSAVQQRHLQPRRKPFQFVAPIGQHTDGCHHQCRPIQPPFIPGHLQQRYHLYGLAQPHVVRQDTA